MLKLWCKKMGLSALAIILLMPNLVFAEAKIDFAKVDVSPKAQQKFYYQAREGEVIKDVLKVKNSSASSIEFSLIAADSKVDNAEYFILKSKNEKQSDIGTWVTFSEQKFILPAGQSKEISFTINVPNNADVGEHKGGILVERFVNTEDGLGLNLQQGVPLVVTVAGQPTPQAKFLSQEFQDANDYYNAFYSFQNEGNVSLDASVRFVISNMFASGERVYTQNVELARGDSSYLEFAWEKPIFGFYTAKAELINNADGRVLDTTEENNFVFLAYLEISLLVVVILFYIFRKTILTWIYSRGSRRMVNTTIAIFLVAAIFSYVNYRFPVASQEGSTSIVISDLTSSENREANYYLVLRWGHLRDNIVDEIEMDSMLTITGGHLQMIEELSVDEDDELALRSTDQVLEIDSQVKDDFDAVILGINSSSSKAFNLAFEDHTSNSVSVYSISELVKGVLVESKVDESFTFGKAEMKLFKNLHEVDSYLESQKITAPSGSSDVLLNFSSATPDVESKDVLTKEETLAVLENILSEESATPDVDTSLKLNSDFVEEIVQSEVGSEILASKDFIAELLASPAVLAALAATAQANVVFLPADTIVFPKQTFSFEEKKIASTVIGTLVFIHKKDRPWNAYVSSTDFEILSGGEKVPASNLSIVPGPVIPINNSEINPEDVQRGDKHRLEDEEDQAVLVTTEVEKDVMFIMRPRLELILPPSTRAGVYRGTLTITYIDRS